MVIQDARRLEPSSPRSYHYGHGCFYKHFLFLASRYLLQNHTPVQVSPSFPQKPLIEPLLQIELRNHVDSRSLLWALYGSYNSTSLDSVLERIRREICYRICSYGSGFDWGNL